MHHLSCFFQCAFTEFSQYVSSYDAFSLYLGILFLVGGAISLDRLGQHSALAEILYDQHASKRGGAGLAPVKLISFLVETHNKMVASDEMDLR